MSALVGLLGKPISGFRCWSSDDGEQFAMSLSFNDGSAVVGVMPAAHVEDLLRLVEGARTTLAANRAATLAASAGNDGG